MGRSAIVAGTGFDGRANDIRRHCDDGRIAYLVREPRNPHDKNAVAVYFKVPRLLGLLGERNVHIGYIKAGTAKSIAKKMDSGEKVTAKVLSYYAPEEMDFPRVTLELNI